MKLYLKSSFWKFKFLPFLLFALLRVGPEIPCNPYCSPSHPGSLSGRGRGVGESLIAVVSEMISSHTHTKSETASSVGYLSHEHKSGVSSTYKRNRQTQWVINLLRVTSCGTGRTPTLSLKALIHFEECARGGKCQGRIENHQLKLESWNLRSRKGFRSL